MQKGQMLGCTICDMDETESITSTECLKIDNDLLLRQAQWWSFGIHPVKNASFELEI